MLFKKEFKADKPKSSFLSKLYLTPLQRKGLLKWVLYSLLLILLSVLQDVVLSRFRLFGGTTDLVPCAIFLICIIEGSEVGSVFALISACLYTFSGTAPGAYSMIFITVLAIFVTIFRQGYLRKGFAAAMICAWFAIIVYEAAVFGIGLLLGLTIFSRWIGFVATTGLNLLITPLMYPIVLSISSIGGETWKE